MFLQSLRTNLSDLHWESEAEKKSQGMEMGSVMQEGLESCEVILIRKAKIGSAICINDPGRRRTGNSRIVIQMAKVDEEAKALSGDDILAAQLMIKFLDVLLRIASA